MKAFLIRSSRVLCVQPPSLQRSVPAEPTTRTLLQPAQELWHLTPQLVSLSSEEGQMHYPTRVALLLASQRVSYSVMSWTGMSVLAMVAQSTLNCEASM